MKIRHPLIKELQRKIEKTYALDTGITNIEQYIIGDKGYKEFYAKEKIRTVVKSHSGAKVFSIFLCNSLIKGCLIFIVI